MRRKENLNPSLCNNTFTSLLRNDKVVNSKTETLKIPFREPKIRESAFRSNVRSVDDNIQAQESYKSNKKALIRVASTFQSNFELSGKVKIGEDYLKDILSKKKIVDKNITPNDIFLRNNNKKIEENSQKIKVSEQKIKDLYTTNPMVNCNHKEIKEMNEKNKMKVKHKYDRVSDYLGSNEVKSLFNYNKKEENYDKITGSTLISNVKHDDTKTFNRKKNTHHLEGKKGGYM